MPEAQRNRPAPHPRDIALVTAQLGRRPRGMVDIAARCPAGHPCVITSYPLLSSCPPGADPPDAVARDARPVPFPTLYWLTCPELCKSIARIERGGLIQELDARLHDDDGFAADMRAAHEDYIAAR